jgi:hypothetical protein
MRQAIVVLGALALGAPGWASEPGPFVLGPGTRVRLTGKSSVHLPGLVDVENGRVQVHGGRLLDKNEERVVIEADASTVVVPLAGRRVEGRLAAVEADAYVVRIERAPGAGLVRVPRAALAAVDISRGRASRIGHAAKGLLAGAAVGAAVGLISSAGCHPSDWFCSAGLNAAAGAILLAPIGAAVGAAVPVEHWQRVSPETAVSLGVGPTPGRGVGVALSVRF